MKNIFKSALVSLALGSLLVTSCDFSDFGDINVSPNSPSQPNTGMLFTYSAMYSRNLIMTSSSYDPWMMEWTGYLSEAKNNQYGGLTTTSDFNTSGWYRYAIKQLNTVVTLCQDETKNTETYVTQFGELNNQIAAAITLRSFFMMSITDILGPLPWSEAFKGDEDVWTPKFDTVEEIYKALDEDLTSAFSKFDVTGSLNENDIVFNGDIAKWKKLNATIRMMMAIKLADVDPSTGKARFAKAYADGGMVKASDSFNYTFDSKAASSWFYSIGDYNPSGASKYFAPNKFIVEALKKYNDPRMFTYFTLDGYLGLVPGDPKDVNNYVGVENGLDSNDAVAVAKNGACSVANKYCEKEATYGVITAARCLLVEAEAAQLGWISADPAALYEAGIKASFEYEGAEGVDEYIAAHPLPASKDEALAEIVTQRWLAGFLTDGIEAWSDWRRYNIPYMPLTEYQRTQCGGTTYPYRMVYYNNDIQTNKESYEAMVKANFPKGDDRWSRIWWDVADNAE